MTRPRIQSPVFRICNLNPRQELYDDLIAMGITRMGERKKHELSAGNVFNRFFRHSYKWITLYDEDFPAPLNRLSESIYRCMEKMYNKM